MIGPNADAARNMIGDYAYPAHIESMIEMRDEDNLFGIPALDDAAFDDVTPDWPSILDGLRSRFGARVRHARGCGIDDPDTSGFDEAVALATDADVAVLVLGDRSGLTAACTSGEGRDRSSLDLPGVQEDLARAVLATGTSVVTVLVVGRPCGSEALHEDSAAVLLAWMPGQEGGDAVADTLAGTSTPGGKLPISFPRAAGQVPVFYGHKVSGGRSHWHGDYVDGPTSPLYPFGHGLSYTRFDYGKPVLTAAAVPAADVAPGKLADEDAAAANVITTVTLDLTNAGERDSDEVAQLYLRDVESSVIQPRQKLIGFQRLHIPAGEMREVSFDVSAKDLAHWDEQAEGWRVEPGVFELRLGASSADIRQRIELTVE